MTTRDLMLPQRRADNGSLTARTLRKLLINVLAKAQHGHLVLREQGTVIGCFGSETDGLHAEIDVLDQRCYARSLVGGNAAAGEAFVDGWWTTPDIVNVTRFFSRNLEMMDAWTARFGWALKPFAMLRLLGRANNHRQAKRNILAHYDLGNKLYQSFLDQRMQYSSALFHSAADSLESAQENKLRRLCETLQLKPSDHLLEIGSGWGGLALFAARNYGCRVTTTTISDEQFRFAGQAIQESGMSDRIKLLNCDYRALDGTYDKLVSVEMIEAVGKQYLPLYFRRIADLLRPSGLAMIQAITIADQRYDYYSRTEDFIQKHIFPGGFLPSLGLIAKIVGAETSLILRDVHDMGLDYAKTLHCWRKRFLEAFPQLEAQGYGPEFRRLWEYYLGYCEGGFLERRISAVQILMSNAPHRQD